MGSYLAIGLILIFFVLSFFAKKFLAWRGMPYIYAVLMVFFLVNAMINRGQLYVNLLFAILALGFAIKSFRQVRASKMPKTE